MRRSASVLGILFAVSAPCAVSASILNVPADYPSIQAAIAAAAANDTVLVAPGAYVQSITLKAGVTVQSSMGAALTTIQGDGSWYGVATDTYAVLGANDATIDGFTITGGKYGVYCSSASPTIRNNVISGNTDGIYSYASAPSITGNTIRDNSRYGVSNDTWSAPIVTGNTIVNNPSSGINNDYSSSPVITGNVVSGGANSIASWHSSRPVIANNLVWGEVDSLYNSNGTITNNLITCTGGGSGLYNYFSIPTIENNIVTGDCWAGVANYLSNPTISFNDLWGNFYSGFDVADVYGSAPVVANNIGVDPMFVDAAGGNYHLQAGSPAIDAGSNEAPGIQPKDYDGSPRVLDGNGDCRAVTDIGPFEAPRVITPEIRFDGIDQDCNGYDLTINIIKAVYVTAESSLRVEAVSSYGAQAALALLGYQAMEWKSNQSKWVLNLIVSGNPGQVTVTGPEGSWTSPVTVQ